MPSDQPPLFDLLEAVNDPQDLRQLQRKQLPILADQLRQYLIQSVAQTGGHLSSNLGVVELTIALHYVFNTPDDRLVWDVGHQTYPHKMLTGRRELMHTLRQGGGIAGFPRRQESEYDCFGVGHSSTSISAALGMAVSAQKLGLDRRVAAIIGDGAMTAGMAFEALNNAGAMDANLLVILNDNDMSISENVGALQNYLAKLLSGRLYTSMRKSSEKVLGVMPPVLEFAKRAEEHMKGMMTPGTLFEEFGFNYIGPIDGHDLDTLVTTLSNIRKLSGPQFLHVVTQKGHGYEPAELSPGKFHGVGQFNPQDGSALTSKKGKTYTEVFGDWLVEMAQQDERLMAITPAMCDGSGLNAFAQAFPQRYFDVGIAEQHALTFAAGLACEGLKPVVAIYSTFLQRAYDQLIHDIALQNLPVMFAIDRAGLVGADGPTHAGSFDLSYLRCVPNLVIMAPADENECKQMLTTAYHYPGPSAVRYPRGNGPGASIASGLTPVPIGKAVTLRQGKDVALLAFGSLCQMAMQAGNACDATVVNMRFIKPLDSQTLADIAAHHRVIITLEENSVLGGAGAAVLEALQTLNFAGKTHSLGLPDRFIEHGKHEQMLADCGLSVEGIIAIIQQLT